MMIIMLNDNCTIHVQKEPPKVTFIIKIKSPAEKWLRKYDREIQKHFAAKIRKLQENPDLHGKPLRGLLHGYWELYFEKKFRI